MNKQIKDAAERVYPINNTGSMAMPTRGDVNSLYKQEGFIAGAEWQAKIMYSETEVFNILDKIFHMYASPYRQQAKEFFNKTKK